jgi:hypothetical protein
MKTSLTALGLVKRLLIAGSLSVGTILSHTLTHAQHLGTPQVADVHTVPLPGNQHAEGERTYHGQLLPLYDLLSAGSGRANGGIQSAFGEDRVSPAAKETASREPDSTAPARPYGPTSPTGETSPDSTSIPEAQEAMVTSALDAQPLVLLIDGEQGRESARAGEAYRSKQAYLLVFDPDDPLSQLAYQVAQAMAQTNQLLDEELQTGQPESEASAEVLQNPPPIERVKVTGRLLQHAGLEAIVVTHVERAVDLEPLAPLLEERQKEAQTHQPPAPQL